MDDPAEHMSLVVPIVVVASVGGPFDDASFAAGWNCGHLATRMEHGDDITPAYVDPRILPQLDLAAMRSGYTLDHEGDGEEPYTLVTFVRPGPDTGDLPDGIDG